MPPIYVARGILIESTSSTWLYRTAVEHSAFYQYNFNTAQNIFSGMIQTETPYFRPISKPPGSYEEAVGVFPGDPKYKCDNKAGYDFDGCDPSWAVLIRGSCNIVIGGAGLFSGFRLTLS